MAAYLTLSEFALARDPELMAAYLEYVIEFASERHRDLFDLWNGPDPDHYRQPGSVIS